MRKVQSLYELEKGSKMQMSRYMGKSTICIGENKGADQLRSNCEADQCLYFRYTDSTIPLLSASSHLLWLYTSVGVGPDRKPHCWFSHDGAQIAPPGSLEVTLSPIYCIVVLQMAPASKKKKVEEDTSPLITLTVTKQQRLKDEKNMKVCQYIFKIHLNRIIHSF